MKKTKTANYVTQISLFDNMFESVVNENIYKSSYTSDEIKELTLYGHHWEKDYILFFKDDEHISYETWHLNSDLALLNNNMVYFKKEFLYPFMYKFKSFKEAEMFYLKTKSETEKSFTLAKEPYKKGDVIKSLKTDVPQFEDVYLFKNADKEAYSVKKYVDKINFGYSFSI